MSSSKIKENHNRGKLKKMKKKKKIPKPNKNEIKALQVKRRENKEYKTRK